MKREIKPRRQTKKSASPQAEIAEEPGVHLNVPRLEKMIRTLIDNLEKGEVSGKVSVGDLLKLLQLYKDLTADKVREVEVRWVDRLHREDESGT